MPSLQRAFVVREQRERYGEPVLVRPRLGQGAFRVAVTDAYRRACAVTQEHSLPVLEAAHIKPYAQGGEHEVSNGLLLRSDLHRLFDLGYVTVTPELRLEVSERLRGEFENGRTYLRAHMEQDDAAFRKAALQLVSEESAAGHTRAAEELRELLTRAASPTQKAKTGLIVDIAQPRGDLAELLEGSHRNERFKDIVLSDDTRQILERIVHENRQRASLQGWGVHPRRKLLFFGPPGCGKTLAASVLAGELGMPLMTVRFDALFSRFLGATANHLRLIFQEMPRRPGVYFFDEFDAVAKKRGDLQDVGEMRRIVTSFLQLLDADKSASLLIAATNHVDLLDHAVFRRFDACIAFEKPDQNHLIAVLKLKLARFRIQQRLVQRLAKRYEGVSYADATRSCEDAIRSMALAGRRDLTEDDLLESFEKTAAHRDREPVARS